MAGTITGKHIFYDCSLVVNSVDLSDHVEKFELMMGLNDHPAAAMGELQDYSLPGTQVVGDPKITFFMDYAASKVYATLYAAWAARTIFNIVAKASSAADGATNPAWTVPCFVKDAPVMGGTRGDRHMADVTLKVAGAISVDVTP